MFKSKLNIVKLKYAIFSLFCASIFLHACKDAAENDKSGYFIKFFGNQYADEAVKLILNDNNGYMILANSYDNNDKDMLLLKADKYGNELWRYRIEEDSIDNTAYDYYKTADGSFVVLGSTKDLSGKSQIFVVKVNGAGVELWRKIIGNNQIDEIGKSITGTTSGGSAITGYKTTENFNKIFFLEITEDGDSIGYEEYGGAGNFEGSDIIGFENNSLIITGHTDNSTAIYLIDEISGSIGNRFIYNFEPNTISSGINSYSMDENLYVLSNSKGLDETTKISLVKFISVYSDTSNSNIEFSVQYEKTANIVASSFSRLYSDNGFVIIGNTAQNGKDIYLLKVGDEGQVLLEKTYGGFEDEVGISVEQTQDGGFIILGTVGSGPNSDICLIKTDPMGTFEN